MVPDDDQGDVGVGDDEAAERDPGEGHVAGVELAHPAPGLVAQRVLAEVVEPPADDVAAGVAAEGVAPQQHDVGEQDQGAEAEAEAAVLAPERVQHVVGVDEAR